MKILHKDHMEQILWLCFERRITQFLHLGRCYEHIKEVHDLSAFVTLYKQGKSKADLVLN